jgi:hypothetical protein
MCLRLLQRKFLFELKLLPLQFLNLRFGCFKG